jgi:hypothetical protein
MPGLAFVKALSTCFITFGAGLDQSHTVNVTGLALGFATATSAAVPSASTAAASVPARPHFRIAKAFM